MKSRSISWLVLCLGLVITSAVPLRATESLAEFQARLKTAATHPRFNAAMLGIRVESLETGKLIYEQHSEKLLKPASNAKMYTGALALDRLGPDFRIRTSFYADAKPDKSGMIRGDLVVYGRGDPSFSHRFNDGDYQKAIDQLVDAVAKAGIKRIKGDLVGDESFFRSAPWGDGWTWDDLQEYYGAEVSALTLQENTVDLVLKPGQKAGDPVQIFTKPATDYLTFVNRTKTVAKGGPRDISFRRPVGKNVVYLTGTLPLGDTGYTEASVSVNNAPHWFVYILRDALQKRGIKVGGDLRTCNWLDREAEPLNLSNLTEVAYIESRPMAEIVKNMMKPSQNLYAHLLLLQAGEHARTEENKRMHSDSLGLSEMSKFLSEAGVPKGDVLLEEGSGLSRSCLLKPAASVQLLKYMSKHKSADAYYDSLPIAGVDGTLRSRFKGTPAEKNIHAKTGTIRYVNSISGYVTSKAGEKLVFSIMLNAYSGGEGRSYTDAIAGMLATLEARTDAAP
jgi:serine-type D-Ala-D-Ala carboxypeptidase/endopeptidase (penicillin-binding protein 4)